MNDDYEYRFDVIRRRLKAWDTTYPTDRSYLDYARHSFLLNDLRWLVARLVAERDHIIYHFEDDKKENKP